MKYAPWRENNYLAHLLFEHTAFKQDLQWLLFYSTVKSKMGEALKPDLMIWTWTFICDTWLLGTTSYIVITLEQIHTNFCYQNVHEKYFLFFFPFRKETWRSDPWLKCNNHILKKTYKLQTAKPETYQTKHGSVVHTEYRHMSNSQCSLSSQSASKQPLYSHLTIYSGIHMEGCW